MLLNGIWKTCPVRNSGESDTKTIQNIMMDNINKEKRSVVKFLIG